MLVNQDRLDHLEKNQPLNFADALFLMRYGKRMARTGDKENLHFSFRKPDADYPYILAVTKTGESVQHQVRNEDLFQDDWIIYKK